MNFPDIPYDENLFGQDFQTYWNRSTEERQVGPVHDYVVKKDIEELKQLSMQNYESELRTTEEVSAPELPELKSEVEETIIENTIVDEVSSNPIVLPKALNEGTSVGWAVFWWVFGIVVGLIVLRVLVSLMHHPKKKLRV